MYRQNQDGVYVFKTADSKMTELVQPVSCIINKTKPLIEQKTIFPLELDLSDRFHNIMFLHFGTGNDIDEHIVAIMNVESIQLTGIKASLASAEARMISLGIGEEAPLGLNCGIVLHNPGDSLKNTFMRADDLLQEDKKLMYKKYNLERRH